MYPIYKFRTKISLNFRVSEKGKPRLARSIEQSSQQLSFATSSEHLDAIERRFLPCMVSPEFCHMSDGLVSGRRNSGTIPCQLEVIRQLEGSFRIAISRQE